MTFAAPLALLGLAAIPALVAWYVHWQRGRAQVRAAFVATALVPSVVPHQPGWRRHAVMSAFLVALIVLIFALADPRTTEAAPVESSSVMLVCDTSGSMAATDVKPSRVIAAERAAARFLTAVPGHVSVGVMVFNGQPDVLQSPTTDRAADRNALIGWRPHDGTAIGTAIETALAQLTRGPRRSRPPAAIVLLSDGGSTSGVDAVTVARRAAAQHIPIYTVALGTAAGTITVRGAKGRPLTEPVPPDPQLLARIARNSGGHSYTAQNAGDLSTVYRQLGAKLGHHKVERKLQAGFAGAALALLVLGGGLSLRWFGRLV